MRASPPPAREFARCRCDWRALLRETPRRVDYGPAREISGRGPPTAWPRSVRTLLQETIPLFERAAAREGKRDIDGRAGWARRRPPARGDEKMSLDGKVNLLLAIIGVVLIAQLRRQWNRMSREERESEIERFRLLIPLIGTVYFTWKVLRGSKAVWIPWAAVVSMVALIYGVVRVARKRLDR